MSNSLLPQIASILNVGADDNGKYPFKIIDTRRSLALVHYNSDSVEHTDVDSNIRNIRGLIVDTNVNKVVCSSFGYTPTIISSNIPEAGALVSDINGMTYNFPTEFEMFPITEGSMIRVWKHYDELMISSHRRISCDTSRWCNSGFFKDLFLKYVGDFDLNKITENGNVAYFILMDKNLTISTKFPFNKRDGMVIYIGSYVNESYEINSDLPTLNNHNNPEYENTTLFMINKLNVGEANKHLSQGFSDSNQDQSNPLCLGEGVIITYNVNGTRKVLSINSPSYYRRFKMVDNEPNILFKCYKLINRSYYPKIVGAEDKFIHNFPPIPLMNDTEIENLSSVITEGSIPGTMPTIENLTDKSKESHELRLRTVLTWYAMSLSLPKQLEAFKCIPRVINERKQLCEILCNNYNKFVNGNFEDYEIKYKPELFEYIQHRLKNASEYAKVNSRNGRASKEAILNNIRMGVLRDSGEWLYNMSKVLIHNKFQVKKVEPICENEVCMIPPNSIRFDN